MLTQSPVSEILTRCRSTAVPSAVSPIHASLPSNLCLSHTERAWLRRRPEESHRSFGCTAPPTKTQGGTGKRELAQTSASVVLQVRLPVSSECRRALHCKASHPQHSVAGAIGCTPVSPASRLPLCHVGVRLPFAKGGRCDPLDARSELSTLCTKIDGESCPPCAIPACRAGRQALVGF